MSLSQLPAVDEQRLEQEIAALGPWFHNLRLRGIQTAPNHFLGDYPEV
jgi:tRNA (mo5U34)-methyltransferase